MKQIQALDLFAGTGWGVAAKWLGIHEKGVEIMPEAVATREANGMETVFHDVWDGLDRPEIVPFHDLGISSPPCQTYSVAGHGAGRRALGAVLEAIRLHAYKDAEQLRAFGEEHDPRTALVLAPLAYAHTHRPRWVAFEQVPTVLPVWEACAEALRGMGYAVETGILNAEQYGVPQTRRRAILVAHRDGAVSLPTPTHSRYYSRTPDRLDPGVLPWVSMAQALGWAGAGVTFTQNNKLAHQAVRTLDQPAPTITAGHDSGNRGFSDGQTFTIATPEQVAALQTYPTGRGLTNRPSPTITGGGTETGGAEPIAKFHERYTSDPGWVGSKGRLSTEEAAALQTYPVGYLGAGERAPVTSGQAPRSMDQPAHTVTGTQTAGFLMDDGSWASARPGQVAAFQTYPTDPPFIWKGSKTKQFLQIGNAVPPVLARAILSALITE